MSRKIKSRSARARRAYFERVVERDGWVCWICDEPIRPDLPRSHDEGATIDHVVPLARGGGWRLENLRLAHRCCNNIRGNALVAA